mgnify:CR=1 FL=1
MKKLEKKNGITLISLVITIVILLILAGISISALAGKNGLFTKVKQANKAHVEAEMKEQLTLALHDLQLEKKGEATLDDVTQEWLNTEIKDYEPNLKEDATLEGKIVIMSKNNVIGKFLIDSNLNIAEIEYNADNLEFEYETKSRNGDNLEISIKLRDKVNGIKQIDYPNGQNKEILSGEKNYIVFDYTIELGKEYKFVITTKDDNKVEKTIKIDDYYYSITKTLGENAKIDNNAIKVPYNKEYNATLSTEGNYAITNISVTMGGKTIVTSGNDVVDINTGKIKIGKVTGDINISVTTKKIEIITTEPYVGTSTNIIDSKKSVDDNSQTAGTPLYINFKATLEDENCSVTLKSNASKTLPYTITKNGKYIFEITGKYNGKVIKKEIEVTVGKYMSAKDIVKYDAGDWTEEEVEELKKQNLYMINKEKRYNDKFNLIDKESGLGFTFGGFTYKGDTSNEGDITSGNIITNRNQSVASSGRQPKYSGWQILESKEENGKKYVLKITHAGSPENFVSPYKRSTDNRRAEYLLSGGKRQTEYSKLYDNSTIIKTRSFQMYIDNNQKDLIADTTDKDGNAIKDIHLMDVNEAVKITGDSNITNAIRNIGADYWLASAFTQYDIPYVYFVEGKGQIKFMYDACYGIRPVIKMKDGVYIKGGSGTDADPYILGKD